ncbi:isocitrate/isopropylmalate dehydrogenase family protein [Thermogutta sp.]|uniref:isocitrate/isopropylmalate dehydrogenase family protein n=1 Tax=Thermogutta sp. TaxID=1962930 RepID=UPI003C7A95F8
MPDIKFSLTEYPCGASCFLATGEALLGETFEACRQADAILLGATGLPSVRLPDGRDITRQLDLREKLDLYCGIRPVYLYHPSDTPLKGYSAGEIDFVIVWENTERLFSSRTANNSSNGEAVWDILRITRTGASRVFPAAFELARTRRRHLTLVDKPNVLPSMAFFHQVFEEVAAEYPDVSTDCCYVDATALYLLKSPQRFDVIVTENMFGDILSDLAAGLVGGMGMAPSADVGDRRAVFQPAHGSAPDIAGRGIANPVAAILSAAMMLEWLKHPSTVRGAKWIRNAVKRTLQEPGLRTPDLGGSLRTTEMGYLIGKEIEKLCCASTI